MITVYYSVVVRSHHIFCFKLSQMYVVCKITYIFLYSNFIIEMSW